MIKSTVTFILVTGMF